jgi:hypothetical protein
VSTAPAFPLDLGFSPFSEEQFAAVQFDKPRSLSGLQRLGWGILEDVFIARRHALRNPHDVRSQRQMEHDVAWLGGAEAPIGFQDLCDLLNVSASLVRQRYFALDGHRLRHKLSTFG